jgi:hypothetical protein
MFKSCFPSSAITSDQQLADYKQHYLSIRAFVDAHPEHVFIALSTPPLEPGSTNADEAARARQFANWLKSPEYTEGYPNLAVYDLFDALAESDPMHRDYNMLRERYQMLAADRSPKGLIKRYMRPILHLIGRGVGDSHPNGVADAQIAPELADCVTGAIDRYEARTPLAHVS